MSIPRHIVLTTIAPVIVIVMIAASLSGCLEDGEEVTHIDGPVEDLLLTEGEITALDDRWHMVGEPWSGDYHYPNSTVAAANYWMNSSEGTVAELYIEIYWFESDEDMYRNVMLALPLHDGGEEFGDWSRVQGDDDLTDVYNRTAVAIAEENVGMSMELRYLDTSLSREEAMRIVSEQHAKLLGSGER